MMTTDLTLRRRLTLTVSRPPLAEHAPLAPLAALAALVLLAPRAAADTWSSTQPVVPIADLGTSTKTLVVDGRFKVRDLNVIVTLMHGDTSQLRVRLRSPSGTIATLIEAVPGTGFTHTVLDDESGAPLPSGSAPYTGSFRPASSLSVFDDEPALGAWALSVDDLSAGVAGTLRCFSLAFNGSTYVAADVPVPLPLEGPAASTLAVPDAFVVADAEVTMTLQHFSTGDLWLSLLPPEPAPPSILLIANEGGPSFGFLGTTLDDQATDPIELAAPSYLGRFPPHAGTLGLGALTGFGSAGDWTLDIFDQDFEDSGVLDAWSLHLVPVKPCGNEASAPNYGAGLAGTLGVPELTADDPVLGETVHVTLGNSSGVLAPALLMGAFAPAALPFKGGTLLVSPAFALQVPLFVVPPAITLNASVPASAFLCGQSLYLQTLQADAGAPHGVALSRGLELSFGN